MRMLMLVVAAVPVVAVAQFSGPGEFPQFRAMSGLPGSGYGLLPDGTIDPRGAMAFSSPVAYSLKPWQCSISFGATSRNLTPKLLDRSTNESNSNGTAVFSLGLPLGKFGMATYSLMVLSSRLDNASNFTWTPPGQQGPVTVGVGVQDIGGGGGTMGEQRDGSDPGNSRSWYAVATWQGPNGTYASIGKGSTRFERVFGNLSANLTDRVKAMVEYDSFNWNFGIGFDFGDFAKSPRAGNRLGGTMFLGVLRGKAASWSMSFRF